MRFDMAAETITAFKVSKLRGTAAITERKRALRGVYGPLASREPITLFVRELEARGIPVPVQRPVMALSTENVGAAITDLILSCIGVAGDHDRDVWEAARASLARHGLGE